MLTNWQKRMIAEGRCKQCGGPKDGKRSQVCDPCGKRSVQRVRALRETRIAAGLCPRCGEVSSGRELCRRCADLHSAFAIAWRKKVKTEVLAHYGDVCSCCGERTPEFLSIDHINDSGNVHRRILGVSNIYGYLRSNSYPDGYRLLCHNCNMGRYLNGGICPHDTAAMIEAAADPDYDPAAIRREFQEIHCNFDEPALHELPNATCLSCGWKGAITITINDDDPKNPWTAPDGCPECGGKNFSVMVKVLGYHGVLHNFGQ